MATLLIAYNYFYEPLSRAKCYLNDIFPSNAYEITDMVNLSQMGWFAFGVWFTELDFSFGFECSNSSC